jgi:translation initiation factor 1 (eIF-1/SUI1)
MSDEEREAELKEKRKVYNAKYYKKRCGQMCHISDTNIGIQNKLLTQEVEELKEVVATSTSLINGYKGHIAVLNDEIAKLKSELHGLKW